MPPQDLDMIGIYFFVVLSQTLLQVFDLGVGNSHLNKFAFHLQPDSSLAFGTVPN